MRVETYEQSILQRAFFGPIQAALLDLIRRSDSVHAPSSILDVGCGTCHLLRSAAVRWPQARRIGVDLSVPMIKEAARRMPFAA
jgi:trans-aconitate methyltransferase